MGEEVAGRPGRTPDNSGPSHCVITVGRAYLPQTCMHLVREEDVQLTKESLLLALVPSLCLVEKLFSYNLHHGELQKQKVYVVSEENHSNWSPPSAAP